MLCTKNEKSYVDKLIAQTPLLFCLLKTSPEFFKDQNIFFPDRSYVILYYYSFDSIEARNE